MLPIHLPPLRDRRDDIVPLAEFFLARTAHEEGRAVESLDDGARAALTGYDWPGNVRELANVIRRMVVLGDSGMIPAAVASREAGAEATADAVQPYWRQERRIIEQALAAFDGSIARAAAALELSPSTIYRKRQSWTDQPGGGT